MLCAGAPGQGQDEGPDARGYMPSLQDLTLCFPYKGCILNFADNKNFVVSGGIGGV
jgi:hypothetical protein